MPAPVLLSSPSDRGGNRLGEPSRSHGADCTKWWIWDQNPGNLPSPSSEAKQLIEAGRLRCGEVLGCTLWAMWDSKPGLPEQPALPGFSFTVCLVAEPLSPVPPPQGSPQLRAKSLHVGWH